jgi:hypothetical protein
VQAGSALLTLFLVSSLRMEMGCGVSGSTSGASVADLCVLGCSFAAEGKSEAAHCSFHQPRESILGFPECPPPDSTFVFFREHLQRRRGSAHGDQYLCRKGVLKIP